jgi:hypothetical protein
MRFIIETVSRFSLRKLYSFALSHRDGSSLIKRRREPFFQIATAVSIKANYIQPSVGNVGFGG